MKRFLILLVFVIMLTSCGLGGERDASEALENFTMISMGNGIVFALAPDGYLWTWGKDVAWPYYATVGMSDFTINRVELLNDVVYVNVSSLPMWGRSSSRSSVMAITSDGSLWACA